MSETDRTRIADARNRALDLEAFSDLAVERSREPGTTDARSASLLSRAVRAKTDALMLHELADRLEALATEVPR